jgi:nitrous oxide reductase
MKRLPFISIVALVCILSLSACSGGDAKKLLLGDPDKYYNTPMQAVERLFNTLPGENNIILLEEAVKFKENDKLSDYQKDEFFNQIKKKKFNVKATKVRTHGDYKTVTCTMTLSDGSTVEKKFKVVKEDDVWKTIIGFTEIQDAIYK